MWCASFLALGAGTLATGASPVRTATGPRCVFLVSGLGILATLAVVAPMLVPTGQRSDSANPRTPTTVPAG